MKRILTLALLILSPTLSGLAATIISPEQFGSISPELQDQIVIQQTTNTGTAGIRYVSSSGYYAAFQTFTWSDSASMSGIGVKLAANSNNINGSNAYSYYLRVFAVDALTAGASITETLGDYTFSLTGDYRTVTDYLYFELPEALSLVEGSYYAFEIVGAGTAASRLTLATAQSGTSSYDEGYGFHPNGSNALASNDIPDEISGTGINGMVFFATAVPEPSCIILLFIGIGLAAWRTKMLAIKG